MTAVLTAERTEDYGPIARFGVEEFIADNVMILRNVLEDESRRRTIEILKFRGCDHQKGEYPFTIVPNGGRGAGPASGGIAQIVPSEYFDVVVDGRVVRGATPIAQATTATSMQRAGRASSWRARQTMPA